MRKHNKVFSNREREHPSPATIPGARANVLPTWLTQHPDGVERADQCFEVPLEWLEIRSVGERQMHRLPRRVQVELRFSLGHVVRNGNLNLHDTVTTAGQQRPTNSTASA